MSTSSSHLIPPHGGELVDLIAQPETVNRTQSPLPRLALLGPHPAPALRPRAAAERRLLAAARLHERADYEGVCNKMRLANGTALADADHARRHRGVRQDAQAGQQQGRAARCRRRDARRAPRRRRLAARPRRPRPKAVFGTTSTAHPGVDYLMNQSKPVYVGGTRRRLCSCPRTTTSARCATRRPSCAPSSPAWAGAGSSPSRPATRCTARTRS